MEIFINIATVTGESIRIIYPSTEIMYDGKRNLGEHATSKWYGQLAHDLNNETLLSDLIKQKNDEKFSFNNSINTTRKIQLVDKNLELFEFSHGGQILIPYYYNLPNKIYLLDREVPLGFLGNFLLDKLKTHTNKLKLQQYYSNTVLLQMDII